MAPSEPLAIALYVVFVVLAVLASQRGHRGIGALLVVTVVFLALVWRPYDDFPAPIGRWIAALVLVIVGAVGDDATPDGGAVSPRWPAAALSAGRARTMSNGRHAA